MREGGVAAAVDCELTLNAHMGMCAWHARSSVSLLRCDTSRNGHHSVATLHPTFETAYRGTSLTRNRPPPKDPPIGPLAWSY